MKLVTRVLTATVAAVVLSAGPAAAGPYADDLAKCLVRSERLLTEACGLEAKEALRSVR